MPPQVGAPSGGRMFYTAFGHFTSAFEEPLVMDFIIAGIKWAAGRL
jgi:type 1 glutamine amidotransferase